MSPAEGLSSAGAPGPLHLHLYFDAAAGDWKPTELPTHNTANRKGRYSPSRIDTAAGRFISSSLVSGIDVIDTPTKGLLQVNIEQTEHATNTVAHQIVYAFGPRIKTGNRRGDDSTHL